MIQNPAARAAATSAAAEEAKVESAYNDVLRLVERMHRRFADLIRSELEKAGISDINPVQCMMLAGVGKMTMGAQQIVLGGHHLKGAAQVSIKALVDSRYLEQSVAVDRSVTLRITDKGSRIVHLLRRLEARDLVRLGGAAEDILAAARLLRRVEALWNQDLQPPAPGQP